MPADDPRQRKPDTAQAEQTLGWKATTPLEEGLKLTIAYFESLLSRSARTRSEPALLSPDCCMTTRADASHPISVVDGVIVVATVLAFPIGLYAVHRASWVQLGYPAANFLLAGYLFMRRSPWYAGHIVLVFCFVALVRRLVDAQAGWNPSSPVLLTPYICCLFATLGFIRYWSVPRPRYIGVYLCMLACIAYGVVLAVYQGPYLGVPC